MSDKLLKEAEFERLRENRERRAHWKRWGPYLSERQWATVREDYSTKGACWDYFPHEHARSRAYRWGEDGLFGISDRNCRLCFALALWNEQDSILKERLFGLTNSEGNHGEDVKECYYYLSSLPTHSYMRGLYKYPQSAFPYEQLLEVNKSRTKDEKEYELTDTGIFDNDEYFDVSIEYAKRSANDILIRIRALNRGPNPSPLHIVPTLWFRNTWSWGRVGEGYTDKPKITPISETKLFAGHPSFEDFFLDASLIKEEKPQQLFTENETNFELLFEQESPSPYVKDAFHAYLIDQNSELVNPQQCGTKVGLHYKREIDSQKTTELKLRLVSVAEEAGEISEEEYQETFQQRIAESDAFYDAVLDAGLNEEERLISEQAYAGLLWSKQFYYYAVKEWQEGDPSQPAPDSKRKGIRNSEWEHLYNRDVISMPDKWEYPWYAAWDLAFHMVAFARVDPDFAKDQLILFLREWYMHPNGQLPAYEFSFSDVNPPVHAWACWRIYKMTAPRGQRDRSFLERVFHKLLLNFTWWVNQKDIEGKNLFSGGFLGLDNIGVFDRGRPLEVGGHLEQADATAWMAFYCGTMLSMALELACEDSAYEDVASKFFEHFVAITDAMNTLGGSGLWLKEDNFYYDQLHLDSKNIPLRIRSLVGLIPLVAVEVIEDSVIERLPGFKKRMEWFLDNRRDLAHYVSYMEHLGEGASGRSLLAVPSRGRLECMLRYVLDEDEFLSQYGVRSLSKFHEDNPYRLELGEEMDYEICYEPAESRTEFFGGNSNWRGPVWFPVNFLIIEALERYHHFYGDSFKIECPSGSGNFVNLKQVAQELSRRLVKLFLKNDSGLRPALAEDGIDQSRPGWQDLLLFYEHFHGDTGRGLGASHQTGWTALVALCIEKLKNAPIKP